MRFLTIFAFDFVSATVDLIIFLNYPKIEDANARLNLARRQDIENTVQRHLSPLDPEFLLKNSS